MRKRNAMLIMPLLALAVLGFAIPGNAQTVVANSCSRTDMQTVITSAPRGATITVPAGSCTWGSTLTITKGLTLTGAGAGSTIIFNGTGDGTVLQLSPDSTAIANDEIIKVSGFTFDGNGNGYALVGVNGAPDTGTKPFKNLIITANTFQHTGSGSGNGNTCIYVYTGQVRGVIYSNTFDRCDIVLRPMGSDTTTEWSNTAYNNLSYGSADNLFFEDNTIEFTSSYTSSDGYGGWIESGQGGRVVVRFNTWNAANLTNPSEWWDVHGFQYNPGGETGTMIVEYYDNKLTNMGGYRWLNHRGSWGMFFDNTYSGTGTPDINASEYQGSCPSNISPKPTNYNPLINNTYVFNNKINGSVANMTLNSADEYCGVAENANWWNENSSFNGTTGIGRGPKASMPATCTTGVGYWATDEGSWNTKIPAGTSGDFYKCTATNTWSLYHTPYTYPDPLRSGSGTGSLPASPTNLIAIIQ